MVRQELVNYSPFFKDMTEEQKTFVTDKLVNLIFNASPDKPLGFDDAEVRINEIREEALAI